MEQTIISSYLREQAIHTITLKKMNERADMVHEKKKVVETNDS